MARTKSCRRRTCPSRPAAVGGNNDSVGDGSTSVVASAASDLNVTVADPMNTSYGGTISSESMDTTDSVNTSDLYREIAENVDTGPGEIDLEPDERSLLDGDSGDEISKADAAAPTSAGETSLDVTNTDSAVGTDSADTSGGSLQVNETVGDTPVEDPPIPNVAVTPSSNLHACVSMITDAVHFQKAMTTNGAVDSTIVSS